MHCMSPWRRGEPLAMGLTTLSCPGSRWTLARVAERCISIGISEYPGQHHQLVNQTSSSVIFGCSQNSPPSVLSVSEEVLLGSLPECSQVHVASKCEKQQRPTTAGYLERWSSGKVLYDSRGLKGRVQVEQVPRRIDLREAANTFVEAIC